MIEYIKKVENNIRIKNRRLINTSELRFFNLKNNKFVGRIVKINKILSTLTLVAVLALPVIAIAAPPVPLPGEQSWDTIKTFITGTLYTVGGFIIVVMLLVSGIMFVTAGGSPEKVATARNTLMYAVVGGVVLVLAGSIWAIISGWI